MLYLLERPIKTIIEHTLLGKKSVITARGGGGRAKSWYFSHKLWVMRFKTGWKLKLFYDFLFLWRSVNSFCLLQSFIFGIFFPPFSIFPIQVKILSFSTSELLNHLKNNPSLLDKSLLRIELTVFDIIHFLCCSDII